MAIFRLIKILLIPDSFVGREQKVEPSGLSDCEQFAIRNLVPLAFYSLCDLVTRKRPGNAAWRAVVKENAHQSKYLRQQEPGARRGCGRQIRARPESAPALHETAR